MKSHTRKSEDICKHRKTLAFALMASLLPAVGVISLAGCESRDGAATKTSLAIDIRLIAQTVAQIINRQTKPLSVVADLKAEFSADFEVNAIESEVDHIQYAHIGIRRPGVKAHIVLYFSDDSVLNAAVFGTVPRRETSCAILLLRNVDVDMPSIWKAGSLLQLNK